MIYSYVRKKNVGMFVCSLILKNQRKFPTPILVYISNYAHKHTYIVYVLICEYMSMQKSIKYIDRLTDCQYWLVV